MRTLRKLAAAAVAATFAVAAVSVVQPGQASGDPKPDRRSTGERTSEVIRLVEADGGGRNIDAKPKGASIGDYFAFNSMMENLRGRRVGRVDGFAVRTGVGPTKAYQHFVTLTLAHGQITTQSASLPAIENGNGPQAITGGTDRYRHARGQVTFEERGDRVIVVVHLVR